MAKQRLFLFDGATALSQAILCRLKKSFEVQAFSHKSPQSSGFTASRPVIPASIENRAALLGAIRNSTHIVFASEHFSAFNDIASLRAYEELVVKAYEATDDESARCFIFLSTSLVYPSDKKKAREGEECYAQDERSETALRIEDRLLSASIGRRLKPIILRSGVVYGSGVLGFCLSVYQIFSLFSHLGLAVPSMGKGGELSLIHVDSLAAAIIKILNSPPPNQYIIHLMDATSIHSRDFFAHIARVTQLKQSKMDLPSSVVCSKRSPSLSQELTFRGLGFFIEKTWQVFAKQFFLHKAPLPQIRDIFLTLNRASLDPSRSIALSLDSKTIFDEQAAKELAEAYVSLRWIPEVESECIQPWGPRLELVQNWAGYLLSRQKSIESYKTTLTLSSESHFFEIWKRRRAVIKGKICIEGFVKDLSFVGKRLGSRSDKLSELAGATLEFSANHLGIFSAELSSTLPRHKNQVFIKIRDEKGRTRLEGKLYLNDRLGSLFANARVSIL